MRRGFLVLLLFGLAAGAFVASGCGESDSTADQPTAISRADFIDEANAICANTNQELTKTAEDFSKKNTISEEQQLTEAQVGELSKLALPLIVKQFEELRALGVPAGDEKQVDAILSAAEEAIEKGERNPAAIYGADGGAFAKANGLATDYGLDKCGE
jgi:hypothetical protein